MVKNCWVFILGMGISLTSGLGLAANHSYESLLTPGARLLAGDASKNEFYILGKDEEMPRPEQKPVKIVLQKIPHIVTAPTPIKKKAPAQLVRSSHVKIKLADKKNRQLAKHHSKIELAVKPVSKKITISKLAKHKPIVKNKLALHTVKKPTSKKIAANTVIKKVVAARKSATTTKKKLALNKFSTKQIAANKTTKKVVAIRKSTTTAKKKLALNKLLTKKKVKLS